MTIVLGILLILMAIFLTIAVLMQHGKNHNLGTIAGGAETFFGKTKGRSIDAMLSKLTTIVSVIFVIIVILMYLFQPNPEVNSTVIPGDDTIVIGGENQTEGAQTPAEGTETPAEGTETPAEGTETPAEGIEAPSEGEVNTPAKENTETSEPTAE